MTLRCWTRIIFKNYGDPNPTFVTDGRPLCTAVFDKQKQAECDFCPVSIPNDTNVECAWLRHGECLCAKAGLASRIAAYDAMIAAATEAKERALKEAEQ